MNWKLFYTVLILFTFAVVSCNRTDTKFPQAKIDVLPTVDVKINRYGKALFELDTTDLQNGLKSIKPTYKLFLDADLNDSSNIRQLYNYVTDTQLISIYKKTIEVYPNSRFLENQLSDAFSGFIYQFPDETVPEVYTYISDLYYELPVWLKDSVIVVAIDLYLGNDFPLYQKLGLPYYKVRCMQPQALPVDVMKAMYFNDLAPVYQSKTLLDRMIDGGKILAYLDAMFPRLPDGDKICYTQQQLDWANQNEENIWAFLISNKLLYSKDFETQSKLIRDGPFTTGFGNKSPSRLGIFIGWKIVLSYLNKHPEVSLKEMIKITDSQKFLQDSGYKPK